MQTILAVETSTQACSACLKRGEDVYLEYELAPQKHADRLLPMVDSVLKQAAHLEHRSNRCRCNCKL